MIAHLDLLIGSRFHSLVFALATGVPAMAIGWSHKYTELMRLMGLERFVLERPQLDAPKAVSLLTQAWAERGQHKEALLKRIPSIHGQINALFDDVASELTRCGRG